MSAPMSIQVVGGAVGAAACLVASPYLARLTLTVADRGARRWWRGAPASLARLAATAVLALVVGALAGAAARWGALLPAFLVLALAAVPLIVVDVEHHRLPDRIVAPAAAASLVLGALAAATRCDWPAVLRAVEGAACVFAALLALRLISPASFGYGDVKLGGIVGGFLGWFGWAPVLTGIVAGFLLGSAVALAMLAARRVTLRGAVPFGPMLILGPLAVLALGPHG